MIKMFECLNCDLCQSWLVVPHEKLRSEFRMKMLKSGKLRAGEGMIEIFCKISDGAQYLQERAFREDVDGCSYKSFLEEINKGVPVKNLLEDLRWLHDEGIVGYNQTLKHLDALTKLPVTDVVHYGFYCFAWLFWVLQKCSSEGKVPWKKEERKNDNV